MHLIRQSVGLQYESRWASTSRSRMCLRTEDEYYNHTMSKNPLSPWYTPYLLYRKYRFLRFLQFTTAGIFRFFTARYCDQRSRLCKFWFAATYCPVTTLFLYIKFLLLPTWECCWIAFFLNINSFYYTWYYANYFCTRWQSRTLNQRLVNCLYSTALKPDYKPDFYPDLKPDF